MLAATPVSLQGGQVVWLLPGRLRAGETVRCVVGGSSVTVKVPVAGSLDAAARGGAKLQVELRNGAARIACGETVSALRRPRLPYVIGQNGLGLIPGPNHLAALERLFGPRAGWRRLGLDAVLRAGVLRRAVVTSPRWQSLSGVRVGDPLARMLWESPATRVSATTWRLARGRSGSLLLAIVRAGRVARLEAVEP